jgi:hypothetical protein
MGIRTPDLLHAMNPRPVRQPAPISLELRKDQQVATRSNTGTRPRALICYPVRYPKPPQSNFSKVSRTRYRIQIYKSDNAPCNFWPGARGIRPSLSNSATTAMGNLANPCRRSPGFPRWRRLRRRPFYSPPLLPELPRLTSASALRGGNRAAVVRYASVDPGFLCP